MHIYFSIFDVSRRHANLLACIALCWRVCNGACHGLSVATDGGRSDFDATVSLQFSLQIVHVPHHPLRSTTPPSSKYHTTLFKVPHHPLQSTTPPSSKYHTPLFKVPQHPLQSTTHPSSKYHTTIFKVPHHPLQSTTQPSSKYHTTLFKVPHHTFFIYQTAPKMLQLLRKVSEMLSTLVEKNDLTHLPNVNVVQIDKHEPGITIQEVMQEMPIQQP